MAKNITLITGSPRSGGNTDLLADGIRAPGDIGGYPSLEAAYEFGKSIR